ncbi:MAG TPA: DUF308 domain-containing protein [Terriglobales bacterium]|nr:DUF308 domain-containing protein [Terriglobales bacterium]
MKEQSSIDIVHHASTWSIVWGILLIVFGMLAISSPMVAAFAANIVIAWLILLAGAIHVVVAFHAHRAGSIVWKLLVGIAYLCLGVYLLLHPVLAVASLTLLLACLFLIEGILNIILFFQMRTVRGSGWVLMDGIITIALGSMIYFEWPSSSAWAIGTLVGISMIISGVGRVMISLAVRKAGTAIAQSSTA